MTSPLRVLLVEDSPLDAELVRRALRKAGYDELTDWVQTEEELRTALERPHDVILCDFTLPELSAVRALEVVGELGVDVPFIIVSATVGEDTAVDMIRRGAEDYLIKDRLGRLGLAVSQAMERAEQRRGRRKAEAALRESEERFRMLAERIEDAFWIAEPGGDIVYASPAWERIWGRPAVELYANPELRYQTIHPEDRARMQTRLSGPHDEARDDVYRIVRPDGSTRWIFDRAFPVSAKDGSTTRVVGIARDITKTRELEGQYRQAQKMEAIGQLAGGIAHDFNNVLSVVQCNTDTLLADPDLAASDRELLGEIQIAANRATALTRQLLTFGRRQPMRPIDVDLNEVVRLISRLLSRVLPETVRVNVAATAAPLCVHADPTMIEQVLLNLAVNARDAMPGGGNLDIEVAAVDVPSAGASATRKAGEFVCLRVKDSGTGIAPEILSRIFEPFFTTKDVDKGTGLGLATVYGIVERHDGFIEVDSVVDKGTTFSVYFRRVAQEKRRSVIPSVRAPKGNGATILLVEDDAPVRRLSARLLKGLGYAVLEAENGAAALDVWARHKSTIRLLFTDLVMPGGMTGQELAGRLRADDARLKVVLTSGYSPDLDADVSSLGDGFSFLAKPFARATLAEVLHTSLEGDARSASS